ncbi:hypothetical protein [Gordonia sp. (in: high G+C Gram-positive bacteria)]|uniref:hypothetical protein n=1 Tax=unclassified Gordonia (in: high G+C Gram-positive bacteria) TaxID=2657482 RepID=UPI00260797BA|nr:hypothetical protein [Gordonia sp. (in: high G+C Gram-positive bacteria)]
MTDSPGSARRPEDFDTTAIVGEDEATAHVGMEQHVPTQIAPIAPTPALPLPPETPGGTAPYAYGADPRTSGDYAYTQAGYPIGGGAGPYSDPGYSGYPAPPGPGYYGPPAGRPSRTPQVLLVVLIVLLLVAGGVLIWVWSSSHDDATRAAGPTRTTQTATTTLTTTAPPAAPGQQLADLAAGDRGSLGSGRWSAQLSAKKPGLNAENRIWDDASILDEHQRLRNRFPQVKLLNSSDWPVFSYSGWWVTVMDGGFVTPEAANAWCRGNGFDPDHCFAKLVSVSGTPEGTTRYWN